MDLRTCIIVLIIWGILIYIIALNLNTSIEVEESEILKRTNIVLRRIHSTGQKNMKTFNLIENYLINLFKMEKGRARQIFEKQSQYLLEHDLFSADIQLSSQYVGLRVQVSKNTHEMLNYFSAELKKIRKSSGIVNDISEQIRNVLELGVQYKRSILFNIDRMRTVDFYELWRRKESENFSDIIQKRLSTIQNPVDCKNAKKCLCQMKKCGLGCELHHLVYCLIIAYVTKRTMILDSRNWTYHKGGWEEIFQPVSETCTEYIMTEAKIWPGSTDTKLLLLPADHDGRFMPSMEVPESLVRHIMKFNCNPSVWWISQFLKYLFKPETEIQKILGISMEKPAWKKPIVGVHIRGTDKIGMESMFHPVEEYMAYVEEYYLTLEMSNTKVERRVFLATDDPNVIKEARRKYPQYSILGDINIAKLADISTRYTVSSLYGTILDIHELSLSDYLVCTISSNLCRIAYEIMSNYYCDSCNRLQSLDYFFYYTGQNHHREVILSHEPRNFKEIVMKCGDIIKPDTSYSGFSNGFSKGKNKRTRNSGLFPLFKLKSETIRITLPTDPNVVSKII